MNQRQARFRAERWKALDAEIEKLKERRSPNMAAMKKLAARSTPRPPSSQADEPPAVMMICHPAALARWNAAR